MPQNFSKFLKISQNVSKCPWGVYHYDIFLFWIMVSYFFLNFQLLVQNMFAKVCLTEVRFQLVCLNVVVKCRAQRRKHTHVIVRDIKDSKHVKTQHYIKSGSVKSGHVKHVKLLIGALYCFHVRSMSWSKKPVVFCVSLFPCATVLPASLALKQTMFGSVTVKVKDLHFRSTSSLDFPPCCHVGESCCEEGSCCSAASAHDDDASAAHVSTAHVSACHAASHGSQSSRCCYWGRLWWRCGSRGWCIIKVRSFSTTRTKLWQMEKRGNSQLRHIHFQATPCSTEWGLRRVEWEPGWFSDMWVVKSRVAHFDLAPYTASTFNFNCCFPCLGFGFVLVFFGSSHEFCVIWKYYYFTR